ncbi:MAG: hypothetical protein WC055_00810 [Melioribacteraceae bacterium]
MYQIPAVYSLRYVKALYGNGYEDKYRFKEWQLMAQGYMCLDFNVG